ncbi:8023_t:CDS:10 [Paraglomus occultum]|uniref:8023_t:CDS:1 n=1 Tax=Paraglomus occultum TaxID=144539 RepID=A0A9N8W8D1_9GLOM|nr:8023_t:CDS:10 [Paraglomus occultum]
MASTNANKQPSSILYVGPVTSLKFHNSKILLAGHGPLLKVFYIPSGELLNVVVGLECLRIRGIVHVNQAKDTQEIQQRKIPTSDNCVYVIYGGKTVRVLEMSLSYDDIPKPKCKITFITPPINLRDWILDINWVYGREGESVNHESAFSEPHLCVAYAHNVVDRFTYLFRAVVNAVTCPSQCILYSARFYGHSWEKLLLAAGTVFNEVHLWSVKDGVVLKKFVGHEGVIFNVRFSFDGSILASVSDDRTIRVWKTDVNDKTKPITLYGHMARIWDCQIVGNYLVSISEDSTCRVWQNPVNVRDTEDTLDIDCLACWEGHVGKNVWSLSICEEKGIVATGGQDSGIRLWSLLDVSSNKIDSEADLIHAPLPPLETYHKLQVDCVKPQKSETKEYVRNCAIVSMDEIVVGTNLGHILLHNHQTHTWTPIFYSTELSNYNMMTASKCGRIVCCGGINGQVFILSVRHVFEPIKLNLHPHKVFELFILDTNGILIVTDTLYIISHAVHNDIYVLELDLKCEKSPVRPLFKLAVPPRFLLMSTAYSFQYGLLFCGSREGGLGIYQLPSPKGYEEVKEVGDDNRMNDESLRNNDECLADTMQSSTQIPTLYLILYKSKTHRRQALTSIALEYPLVAVDNNTTDDANDFIFIYTTGRDGEYIKYRLKGVGALRKQHLYTRDVENIKDEKEVVYENAFGENSRERCKEKDGSGERDYVKGTEKNLQVGKTRSWKGKGESDSCLQLEEVYRAKITKGWLEQAVLFENTLFLLGFYRKRFFVFNQSKSYDIFSVACGGAHRVWHFSAADVKLDSATFLFIRKEKVYIYSRTGSLKNDAFTECKLGDDFHGRETRSVSFCRYPIAVDNYYPLIFATGAEDSLLRLFQYIPGNMQNSLRSLCCIKKHTSVIRSIQWSKGKELLLFTSGASEELRCWKIELTLPRDRIVREGSPLVDVNCLEWGCCPSISDIPEMRIMSTSVHSIDNIDGTHVIVSGYSDSILRVWLFTEKTRSFTLVAIGQFHDNCILKVKGLVMKDKFAVLTSATDGRIAVWDISDVINRHSSSAFSSAPSSLHQPHVLNPPLFTSVLHQSGVNVFDIVHVNGYRYLLASGGDDNAIVVKEIEIRINEGILKVRNWARGELFEKGHLNREGLIERTEECVVRVENAHASSIQGLKFLNASTFVSVSLDQRLNVWNIKLEDNPSCKDDMKVKLKASTFVDVCDPACLDMTLWNEEAMNEGHSKEFNCDREYESNPVMHAMVGVAGIGFQLFRI